MPISLAVTGNLIAVADIMKSVSVVRYTPSEGGTPSSLTEVARHFLTAWATAVAHVAEDTYLESDAEGNLMVLRQNVEGVTADDRRRLECVAECRLGEMVNRIVRLDVSETGRGDETVLPRAFMATADGSIYLFALIHPSRQDLLMRMQTNIAHLVNGPGNVPFLKFRAFRNEVREGEEPFRFVDGELIERFLDCDLEVQEEIVSGLEMDVEAAKIMVEGLRRLC
jgi:DNA damage-binding protein 1